MLRAITTAMSKRNLMLVFIAAACVLALGAGWWLTRAEAVSGVEVRASPLVRTLQFSARVSALSRVDIGSTITGRVLQVLVKEGDVVKKGDVLLVLETDELKAAVLQAQANEQLAAAKLTGLRSTGRSAVQSNVTQAESVLIAAQAELQRTQKLVAQGFLSPARLDEVLRAVAVAQAQVTGAQAQKSANADQGTDIVQAQAQLVSAKSATTAAKARLAQAAISAPADAKVIDRLVEPGQIVQAGRSLLSLTTQNAPLLTALVDERYLEQLQLGQSATVLADAYPGQRFTAKVEAISPLVDAQRGAIEVKFSVTGKAPAFLREDMTLSVEVETAKRERALVLPVNALRAKDALKNDNSNTSTVYVAQDGRVSVRPVKLGLRTLNAVEVLEGLQAGEGGIVGTSPDADRKVKVKIDNTFNDKLTASDVKAKGEDAGSAMTNAMGR
jgi:HlyD family secretion protein